MFTNIRLEQKSVSEKYKYTLEKRTFYKNFTLLELAATNELISRLTHVLFYSKVATLIVHTTLTRYCVNYHFTYLILQLTRSLYLG